MPSPKATIKILLESYCELNTQLWESDAQEMLDLVIGGRFSIKSAAAFAFTSLIVGSSVFPAHAADNKAIDSSKKTDPQWSFEINQEVRSISWSGKRGFPTSVVPFGFARGRGFEYTSPLGLQLTGHAPGLWNFEILLRGNAVKSSQKTPGLQGTHLSLADTVVASTFTYEGFGAFKPFVSLALNLPTGDRRLSLSGTRSRMDSDIVDVPAFGEGRNIGPTLGANFALTESWLLSTSIGRTFRGRFVQGTTDDAGLTALSLTQPGADNAVNASLNYSSGPFNASAAVALAFPESDRIDRAFSIQQGNRLSVSLDAGYNWSPTNMTKAQFSINHSGRNKVIDNVALAIAVEPFNSNSIRYRASLDHTVIFGSWKFTTLTNLTYRDRNQWQPIDQQFVPAKWKAGGGLQISYDITEKINLTSRLEHFWVKEASQSEKLIAGVLSNGLAIPRIESRGWSGGLSGSLKF